MPINPDVTYLSTIFLHENVILVISVILFRFKCDIVQAYE